ncbi:MAG: hypothetical protein WA162_02555, partial [Thermodesulfobacteriota bacterium]
MASMTRRFHKFLSSIRLIFKKITPFSKGRGTHPEDGSGGIKKRGPFKNSGAAYAAPTARAGMFIAAGLAAVCLLFHATSAHSYGLTQCAGERFGSDLVCTAADVSITGIAVAPGGPTACVGGSTINIDLDVTVNFAVPNRWDVGIFLVNDGKDPELLPINGGSNSCTVAV